MNSNTAKAFNCYEVQRTITRYLDVNDLKRLRLVNKEWMNFALIPLKSKSQVILKTPSSFLSYIDFLNETEFLICFPNYKIVIKPDEFVGGIEEAASLFQQFWELCSYFVKEICIHFPWTCAFPIINCICYNYVHAQSQSCSDNESPTKIMIERISLSIEEVESGSDKWLTQDNAAAAVEETIDNEAQTTTDSVVTAYAIYPIKSMCLSSLISLHLNVSIVLHAEKKVFPFTWPEFFLGCPKFSHLSIQSDYASGHYFHIVNSLVERNMLLKTLKIGTRDQRLFSDDFLRKLSLLTTNNTEIVSFGFLPSVWHSSPLNEILLKTSASLTHLTFVQIRTTNQAVISSFSSNNGGGNNIEFPNLLTLRITKELAPNLHFLQKMPKLRRLEIFRDSTMGQHDNLSNPVIRTRALPVMNSLQSLVLEMFVPVEDVWKLVKWFPNIQRLQMKANDVIARIIFMSWKAIKELYLVGETVRDNNDIVRCTLTDEGLCGVSKEILQSYNGDFEGSNKNDHNVTQKRKLAYVGDLANLEVCRIQTIPDYQSGLTDYSIRFGLADLPKLCSLTLVRTLVSPSGVERLRSRGVYVTLVNN